MHKLITILTGLLMVIPSMAHEREVISLNRDWQFTPGYQVAKNIRTLVSLPHTWNMDAMSGKADYYRGFGNYQKSLDIPAQWEGKSLYLRFGAANHTATVFINGKCVGEHQGGYTAFGFDISKYVTYGATNQIMVRVSNALDLGVMPLLGDFNFYGGLYRDVDLYVLPPQHIAMDHYAWTGVRVIPQSVSAKEANVLVRTQVTGQGTLQVQVLDAQGKVVAQDSRKVGASGSLVTGADAMQTVEVPFTLKNPHLWNGRKDPYLYTVRLLFGQDEVQDRFGLRFYEIDRNNHFYLNGERIIIHGVGKHQDYALAGNAVYRQQMEKDMELMLEMGVNAVRLTHYPHHPYFLSLCDQYGLIVWSEIPFVGPGGYRDKGFVDTERFKANGRQQLSEMIAQYYNHPSIFMWGLFNELNRTGDDPVPYLQSLHQQAKADDPFRYTTSATNLDYDAPLNSITDLIAVNKYIGWYGGAPDKFEAWCVDIKKQFPDLKWGVSEYGAGASPYHQQDSLSQPTPTGRWHPENWQTHYHEVCWKTIATTEYFWGTYVWVMFDFYAAHRTEGERDGINDKGLVSADRMVKKDAFYFYKANWNTHEPFVYVAERRNVMRQSAQQQIKVFSNVPEVELFLNGKSLGKRQNDGFGTFLWDAILAQGQNTIEAKSNGLSDVIELHY